MGHHWLKVFLIGTTEHGYVKSRGSYVVSPVFALFKLLVKVVEWVETDLRNLHANENFVTATLQSILLHLEKVVEHSSQSVDLIDALKLAHFVILLSLFRVLSIAHGLLGVRHSHGAAAAFVSFTLRPGTV